MADKRDLPNPNMKFSSVLTVDFSKEFKQLGRIRSFKRFIGKHHNMKEIMNDVKIGIQPGEDIAFVSTLSGVLKHPVNTKKELNPLQYHELRAGFSLYPGRYNPHGKNRSFKREKKSKKKKSKKSKTETGHSRNNDGNEAASTADKASSSSKSKSTAKAPKGEKAKVERKVGYKTLLNKLKRSKYYCP